MKYSKNQQVFFDAVLNKENVFLSGQAGTGKSFIVKEVISYLKSNGVEIVAVAPTGVAANNIGGQTIHSLFQINPFGVTTFEECNYLRGEKRRMLDKIQVIFVDEVSMLRPDILDGINYTLVKNGSGSLKTRQIIFIGDLKQLQSPIDDNTRSVLRQHYDADEFYNAKIFHSLNVREIHLDEVVRQTDIEFIENLNIVRNGGRSPYFRQFVSKKTKGIILAPHNSTVETYNKIGLNELSSKEIVMDAFVEGNAKFKDFNLESRIIVKNNARIMYLINSQINKKLVNGTIGTFKVIDGKYFIEVERVQYALEPVTISKKEYVLNEDNDKLEMKETGSITQYPFKLAYALTIHKSQGLTFEEVTVDLSRPCFQNGQMYTALSRVTGPKGLTIITK